MLLDVVDVIELVSQGIVDIDCENLPIRLALVDERHVAQDFDPDDGAALVDSLSDLAHVDRVAVALAFGRLVRVVGILPRLRDGAVIPNVALKPKSILIIFPSIEIFSFYLVGKAIGDESQFALLHVLLDGIHLFAEVDFHLSVGPARNFDDHVENLFRLISAAKKEKFSHVMSICRHASDRFLIGRKWPIWTSG